MNKTVVIQGGKKEERALASSATNQPTLKKITLRFAISKLYLEAQALILRLLSLLVLQCSILPPIIRWFDLVNTNNPIRCCECLLQVFEFDILISNFNPPCTIIPVIIPHKTNKICCSIHTFNQGRTTSNATFANNNMSKTRLLQTEIITLVAKNKAKLNPLTRK